MFYGEIMSEILQIAWLFYFISDLLIKLNILIDHMQSQGGLEIETFKQSCKGY